ncbi:MAG: hypothetical protein LBT50_03005 [Prevotellaceae bacterium]|jgi:hypothetical protein|nr:hypothetical protein [Prevotellaceae bacterium]
MTDKTNLLLIFAMCAFCCISCKQSPAEINKISRDEREYTGLQKLITDSTINILENKKVGDRIFFKYRKNKLTGLISVHNDSVAFVNEKIFLEYNESTEQGFEFVDSAKIVFRQSLNFEDKTLNYKYIFRLNDSLNKWLLCYAETKECRTEQYTCIFTDNFSRNFSLEDFSTENFFKDFAGYGKLFSYTYKRKNYLDSISIQVNKMRLSDVVAFKNIFTVDHAEEILRDYPANSVNVLALNNIAYYLDRMSIMMPSIAILEVVIDDYPDRTISYLNLADALVKNNLTVKAKTIYSQYIKLMREKGKQNEIPQRLLY